MPSEADHKGAHTGLCSPFLLSACSPGCGPEPRATRPGNGNLSGVLQSWRTTLCESHTVLCAPGPQPPVRVDRRCSTITRPCQRTPVVVSLSPSHPCHYTISKAPFPSPPHTGPPDLPKPPGFVTTRFALIQEDGSQISPVTGHSLHLGLRPLWGSTGFVSQPHLFLQWGWGVRGVRLLEGVLVKCNATFLT